MAVLIFETGANKGTTIRLDADRVYTFGRDERAEVRIDSELVSRVHAKLRGKDGRFYLKDADSSNGTFVNDSKVDGVHELSSGDRIGIGTEVLSYFADQDAGGAAGRTLGGFQLLQRIGRGGMGTVYRALQKSLNREVALKILAPELARDQKFVEQFLKEARAAGQLNHPNIVQVYDVESDAGLVFYAMEFMPGGTVEDRLNKGEPLPIEQAVDWLLDAARGLQYAEMKKLVHRDIKPDNLMLTDIGTVKIADLGLALASHEGHGDGGMGIHGTPHFISPEQAKGEKLDTRSDLYSLGATFFRMLSGTTPFTGQNAQEILRKQVKDPPPPVKSLRQDVPDKVVAIVDRLLKKEPAERFQTAGDLIGAIEDARAKGNKVAVAAFVLLLLLAGLGGAGWFLGWFGGGGPAVVQQVVTVTDHGANVRAKEAEERAKRAEQEAKAANAFNELTQKRSTISEDEYLAAMKQIAADYPDTDTAARVTQDATAFEADLIARRAADAARSEALRAATSALESTIAGALSVRRFAAAYPALDATDYGSPEIVASTEFAAAVAAQRARIDEALANDVAALERALASAIERGDFAAARDAIESARPGFLGAETVPDSEAAGRDAIARALAGSDDSLRRVNEAEHAWRERSYAEDRKAVLEAIDYKSVLESIRGWKPVDSAALAPLDALDATLRTAEYRRCAAELRADLQACVAIQAEIKGAISRGDLANAKVRHPERDGLADILGMGPDGASIVLQTSTGVGTKKSAVPFAAFDTPAKFAQLADGRIEASPAHGLIAVRATLAHAAACLAPAVATVASQLAIHDFEKGWSTAQESALSGLRVPSIDAASVSGWLTRAETDPALASSARELRKRVPREARVLDLLANALTPFTGAKPDPNGPQVRGYSAAADQLQLVLEELRETLTFFTAYPLFDDGGRRLEFVDRK